MFENLKSTTLSNGTRIVTSAMPGVNSVSVCFSAGMGSHFEKKSEAGWSHFLEHMAFKGSRKRPTRVEIVRPLERIGGEYNAFTGKASTCFFARIPAGEIGLAVDILGDMFANPVIPEAEIEKERAVILEEIKQGHDSAPMFAVQSAIGALWPDHPRGRPVSGFPETLADADAEALRGFHRVRYSSRGTIVAAAGNVDHARFVDMVRPFAEALSSGRAPVGVPVSRAKPQQPLVFDFRPAKQASAVVACRTFPNGDPRKPAMELLSYILGGGMNSRLFVSVREKHGLAYSVAARSFGDRDSGTFRASAGLDASRVARGLFLCGRELRRIAEQNVGTRELEDAKAALSGMILLAGENSIEQMLSIENMIQGIGFVETPEQTVEKLKAVTKEDIRSLSADLFRPEKLTLSLVLPNDCKTDPEKLREALVDGVDR